MEWVNVKDQSEIPTDKTIIVEDENGWIGQAYFDNGNFLLEIFTQTSVNIKFDTIVRYLIVQ